MVSRGFIGHSAKNFSEDLRSRPMLRDRQPNWLARSQKKCARAADFFQAAAQCAELLHWPGSFRENKQQGILHHVGASAATQQ
jgi:hypothetical protein